MCPKKRVQVNTGGFMGSAVGISLGMALASGSQKDLGDLRKFLTYPLYGNAIGNSVGHYMMKRDEDQLPFFISLFSGVATSIYLARDKGYHLDGEYYWNAREYGTGGETAYYLSLVLLQPLITTTTNVLCPSRKISVSLLENGRPGLGLVLTQRF